MSVFQPLCAFMKSAIKIWRSIHLCSTDMTFEQFTSDRKTIDAVVRNFIIIGKAASHLPENFTELHSDLAWREMRDIRNSI